MLNGIARKVAIPVILVSILGWIVFGVGFGLRNFAYQQASQSSDVQIIPPVIRTVGVNFNNQSSVTLDSTSFIPNSVAKRQSDMQSLTVTLLSSAARPEFLMFWMFAAGGLLVFVMTFIRTCVENIVPKILLNLFLPVYLLGAGCVLFYNGILVHRHFSTQAGLAVSLFCTDLYGGSEVTGAQSFAAVEFAGTFVSVLAYWVYLLLTTCFTKTIKVVEGSA